MKIKFRATAMAPKYSIKKESVNGINLSPLGTDDKFIGNDETKSGGIYYAERDANGELWVTLKQAVGAGHWGESDWINSENYDSDVIYVVYKNISHSGTPYAVTSRGKIDPRTNDILGNDNWSK